MSEDEREAQREREVDKARDGERARERMRDRKLRERTREREREEAQYGERKKINGPPDQTLFAVASENVRPSMLCVGWNYYSRAGRTRLCVLMSQMYSSAEMVSCASAWSTSFLRSLKMN